MLLLVHGNMQYARSMLYRIVLYCIVCCIGLYSKCTIACYGTVTMIFLIVMANMEFQIIILIARNFVFRLRSFLYGFSFFSFLLSFAVCVSLHASVSRWVWGWRLCSSLECAVLVTSTRILDMNSEVGTWTGTQIFDWDLGLGTWTWTTTHISVEVLITCSFSTAKLISNY